MTSSLPVPASGDIHIFAYRLGELSRSKIQREARKTEPRLHRLIGHCSLFDHARDFIVRHMHNDGEEDEAEPAAEGQADDEYQDDDVECGEWWEEDANDRRRSFAPRPSCPQKSSRRHHRDHELSAKSSCLHLDQFSAAAAGPMKTPGVVVVTAVQVTTGDDEDERHQQQQHMGWDDDSDSTTEGDDDLDNDDDLFDDDWSDSTCEDEDVDDHDVFHHPKSSHHNTTTSLIKPHRPQDDDAALWAQQPKVLSQRQADCLLLEAFA